MNRCWYIRCGLTADGDIEAAIHDGDHNLRNVVIDPRTGNVIRGTVKQGSDDFRRLVVEARKWVRK